MITNDDGEYANAFRGLRLYVMILKVNFLVKHHLR